MIQWRNKGIIKGLEWAKGALRPSNVKRLYTDEKSAEIGEIQEQNNRKGKGRKIGK